ncbi:MAG: VOC family protein [Clostridiales bacterium]|nr:VOC family protein [Clostridiales bacterium]
MEFTFTHNCFNVLDLEKSILFYREALSLRETRRREAEDGSFILVFLEDGRSAFQLELTWLKDHPEPYDLGECEYHLAFSTPDLEAARALHMEMGCICYENPGMGIYFINDPDGYWIEIVPSR